MQWRVVPSKTPATVVNLFDLTLEDGRDVGVAGFDRSRLDEGVVEVRTLDAQTAGGGAAGNVVVEDSDEESSDGDDDGIWNQAREYDVAEVDDVYDDMMNDIDIVVPGTGGEQKRSHRELRAQAAKTGKDQDQTVGDERGSRGAAKDPRARTQEPRTRPRVKGGGRRAGERSRGWQPAPSARGGPHPAPRARPRRRSASDADTWSEAGSEGGDAEATDAATESR